MVWRYVGCDAFRKIVNHRCYLFTSFLSLWKCSSSIYNDSFGSAFCVILLQRRTTAKSLRSFTRNTSGTFSTQLLYIPCIIHQITSLVDLCSVQCIPYYLKKEPLFLATTTSIPQAVSSEKRLRK